MPAPDGRPMFEPLSGLRVIAEPAALDAAEWGEDRLVLRLAPDDVFAIDVTDITVADEHAIIEPEVGFNGAWVRLDAVRRHVEWAIPTQRPALAQGFVATVPARVWLPDKGDRVLLITATAYVDELAGRLG